MLFEFTPELSDMKSTDGRRCPCYRRCGPRGGRGTKTNAATAARRAERRSVLAGGPEECWASGVVDLALISRPRTCAITPITDSEPRRPTCGRFFSTLRRAKRDFLQILNEYF